MSEALERLESFLKESVLNEALSFHSKNNGQFMIFAKQNNKWIEAANGDTLEEAIHLILDKVQGVDNHD